MISKTRITATWTTRALARVLAVVCVYALAAGCGPSTSATAGAAQETASAAKKKIKFFVAPNGRPDATGKKKDPWDLQTALSHPAKVPPGATIFLRGGTYNGHFLSTLRGAPGAPITVRGFKKERAIVDGWVPDTSNNQRQRALTIQGSWVVFRDFEVTSSDPRRVSARTGSNPRTTPGWRAEGIEMRASNSQLINLVVHNAGQGIGFWEQAVDSEVYGCILINNGWSAADRGHGHGLYIQNETGRKIVRDVISYNNFANGMKAYGQDGSATGVHFDGVVSFNNGATYFEELERPIRNECILVGTTKIAPRDIKILNCLLYQPAEVIGGGVRLGYTSENEDVEVRNNVIACGGQNIWLERWRSAIVRDNFIYTTHARGSNAVSVNVSFPEHPPEPTYEIDGNVYFDASPAKQSGPRSFKIDGFANSQGASRLDFSEWQAARGWDAQSKYTIGRPTGIDVFVRPNAYQKGRATVVVYNWDLAEEVKVKLGDVLAIGADFEIRDVQNFFGPPVVSGTFTGRKVKLPLVPKATSAPTGFQKGPTSTAPEFNVFVVLQR